MKTYESETLQDPGSATRITGGANAEYQHKKVDHILKPKAKEKREKPDFLLRLL
ncbi:hypothetical protein [Pedobacter antarcticus]|uniref:hypothetical protein n=1 Tax=Pedobacter antarcticus TaxID=34086 RepID=UPI0008805713|nr:hypothetical protein [Pedobacter antarcticus]SDL45745.1 hypothetical protein SAMN04488084_101355 [Pedobacter antarcticus]